MGEFVLFLFDFYFQFALNLIQVQVYDSCYWNKDTGSFFYFSDMIPWTPGGHLNGPNLTDDLDEDARRTKKPDEEHGLPDNGREDLKSRLPTGLGEQDNLLDHRARTTENDSRDTAERQIRWLHFDL